jgi:dipeptidyl aminopeptidase/acylaminoacyl peptidase
VDFFIDDQGEILAREDFRKGEGVHRITVPRGSGKWEEVFRNQTSIINHSFVGLTRDRKQLVMIDTTTEGDRNEYFTLSLADGTVEGPILGREDADVEGVINDNQRVSHGVRYSGFTPQYQFLDEALNQRVKTIQDLFPQHSVRLVDYSPDWQHLLVLVEGSQAAGDYYLSSPGKDLTFVGTAYSNIKDTDVHPLGHVTFNARDGLKIPTLLTIPASHAGDIKNLPAVIMPHGGPASHDTIGFDYMAQALAQQGYLVIMPQFRGSSGFGWEHRSAGIGEWGGKMQDDISDAVAHFAGRGMIDPARVCIVGASYGGYAALAGGAFTPDLYRCVVSINGIGDLAGFREWVRRAQGSSSQALAYWEMQIGGDRYTKEVALARSPEAASGQFKAPVLLIHSRRDEIVPVEQSKSMHSALKKQGKAVEYVELDGDDHYLSLGETRRAALRSMIDFVNQNLQN